MRISVIIATLNRREDLLKTLAAYEQQTYPDKEIIVIDNGSTDGTAEAVQKQFPAVRYFWIPDNIETVAINYGMSVATGEIFWLSNNDSYPEDPRAFEQIVKIFTRFPQIDIIGTEDFEVRDQVVYNWHRLPAPKETMPPDGYPAVLFHGTGAAVRRRVIEKIGGFWDQFVYEELDFCIRALRAGCQIRYFPTIRTLHFASPASRVSAFRWRRAYLHTLRLLWKYAPAAIALWRSLIAAAFFFVTGIRNRVPIGTLCETYLEALPTVLRTIQQERQPLSRSELRQYRFTLGSLRDYWAYAKAMWNRIRRR